MTPGITVMSSGYDKSVEQSAPPPVGVTCNYWKRCKGPVILKSHRGRRRSGATY